MNNSKKLIVVPADSPTQIKGSPHLELLKKHAEVKVYADFPSTQAEKIRRVENADILINSRSSLHWSRDEFKSLPKLKMMSTCSVGTDGLDVDLNFDYHRNVRYKPIPEGWDDEQNS